MPKNNKGFNQFSRIEFNQNSEIQGLESFTKNLEKHFFSQVTIRKCCASTNVINLVVELDCNFGLLETLHHFEKDTWGNFKSQKNSFSGALNLLSDSNDLPIQIEEFTLFLKDTSIIVTRIYDLSISLQLENIFKNLIKHSLYFTRGHFEIPFEIYMPVFEDSVMENENELISCKQATHNSEKDYFSFWGLYYYSDDDAVVYDLKNQTIVNGNLQMLNR